MNYFKIITFGLAGYFVRFAVGGILYLGVKMDPIGFWYGASLTAVALVASYLLLKFVIKPANAGEAFLVAAIWVAIAFALDMITAQPVVHVSALYMLGEPQFWTRLAAILVVVPFAVAKTR